MADQIKINYELMSTVKGKFSDKSEQINNLKQVLSSQIDELRAGGWIGQGANSFYSEMDQFLLPVLMRLIQALAEAESTCQTIANEFENAETEAQQLVNFTFEA